MEAFKDREKGTVLHHLHTYWVTLPRGRFGLPHESNFFPKTQLPAQLANAVSWIDTKPGDPLKFVMRDHQASTIPGLGTELSDTPLCERPDLEMHTTACAIEFLFCKHERKPLYHEIEQTLGGLRRHYSRLMLPVENGKGEIDRIYYATRQLQPVKRETFHFVEQG